MKVLLSAMLRVAVLISILNIAVGCNSGHKKFVPVQGIYELTLSTDAASLETGEQSQLFVELKDDFGQKIQLARLHFTVNSLNDDDPPGYISSNYEMTDTTKPSGLLNPVYYISDDEGEAIVSVLFEDNNNGVVLDSAGVTISSEISKHSINFSSGKTSLNIDEPTSLNCFIFSGSQESPTPASGKKIFFFCHLADNPDISFGSITPDGMGISDENGRVRNYFFQSSQAGSGTLKAVYYNLNGDIATWSEILITVSP